MPEIGQSKKSLKPFLVSPAVYAQSSKTKQYTYVYEINLYFVEDSNDENIDSLNNPVVRGPVVVHPNPSHNHHADDEKHDTGQHTAHQCIG